MEITIHIPSIDNLAEAVKSFAHTYAESHNCTCVTTSTVAPMQGQTEIPLPVTPTSELIVPPVTPVTPAPVQAVTYTRQQLAVAATGLVDAGKKADLLNLLADFQIKSMTELQEENFGAFATALRGLGAAI